MTDPNQRQRQMLSPFTIGTMSQVNPANPETLSNPPSGTEQNPVAFGPGQQTYLPGRTLQQPVQSPYAMPSHPSSSSFVHPGFQTGVVGSVGPTPAQQAEFGFGVSPAVGSFQQPGIAGPVTAPQTQLPQRQIFGSGSVEPVQPAVQSPGLTHPAFGRTVGQIGSQPNVGSVAQQNVGSVRSGPSSRAPSGSIRAPPMTVFDEGEDLLIEFELPGVSKKDIDLVGRERGLVLKAAAEEPTEEGEVLTSEGGSRVYQREVPLDIDIVADDISASFRNGILKVTLPKKEPTAGPKSVEID